jgi:uncharacterized protein YcgI (DUF1989 family)
MHRISAHCARDWRGIAVKTKSPNSTWAPGELLKYEQDCGSRKVSEVPGKVLVDVLVPARGFLPAPLMKKGQVMRIIDVEGQQVADLILYDPNNLKNPSSMNNTVLVNKNYKITKGHAFYSKFGDRMATIIEDTVGTNVVTGGFCNPGLNRQRYGIEGTHTCQANLTASMAKYGFTTADIEEGCWCAFMNVTYEPDGRLEIRAPISKPNDYLDMRADMDILVAFSNCPSEHNPCNGWNPTPLRVIIYEPR